MTIVSYAALKRKSKSLTENPILKTAVEAALRGWSVIPVNENKEAIVKWKEFQHRKAELDEIMSWHKADKIAVVTGEISGVIVLDVDPGGETELNGKHLPITPTVRTPRGGTHYYYKYPGENVPTKAKILNQVDIRGDGGYAVIPDSDGYVWIDGLGINEVAFADPPQWLMDLLKKPEPKQDKQSIKQPKKKNASKAPVAIGAIEGDRLTEWFKNDDFVYAAARYMGIPDDVEIGESFCCIIPGHNDEHPSASLFREPINNTIIYRDWHAVSGQQWYTLPEVRASLAYGQAQKLSAPEHAVWALRLLVETGYIQPVFVDAPQLPASVRPTVRKMYDGFVFLLSCKWLHSYGEPTPFTWKFATAWCNVSRKKVAEGLKIMLSEGYICKADVYQNAGKKMALYNLPEVGDDR